jgi:hypothetical protein
MNRSIRLILFITLIMLSLQIASPLVADTIDVTKTTDQAARPNIMIPEPLYTFDAVVDGTEVVHDFRVYNRGTGELIIEKVQTG